MSANFFTLFSFVLITTFSPGPANISSASMAVLHGYRKTFHYLGGLGVGAFLIMLLGGLISASLLDLFPALESVLRYAGAAYILYLAFSILKASYTFTEQEVKPLGFLHGILLQLTNPKLIVYAFTLFSAFLAPLSGNAALLIVAAALLASVAFFSTNVWALFGTAIKTYLRDPRIKLFVNLLLALFLVYAAIELAGVI